MKARVKATGEIVEVHTSDDADFVDRNGKYYWEHELFFGSLDVSSYDDADYWTRLEHTYAGMAMQGLMSYVEQITPKKGRSFCDEIVDISFIVAHALVEKLKEMEERK